MLARPVLAAVGCAVAVAVTALPADAAGAVQLGKIQYDAPGSDASKNASVTSSTSWSGTAAQQRAR